jgi:hypothetical protein
MALVAAAGAWAQVDNSPGVARISLIRGDVSTQRGDSGDWSAAALNAPLMAGDKISTGDNSRTELQLDPSNILRLGDQSRAQVSALSRTGIQVQIAQGLVSYSVFKNSEAEPEIDTPNVAIHPARQDGSFGITVSPDGSETQIAVRKGEAEISTPQGSTRVTKGQLAVVRGTGNDVAYKIDEAPGKDDWDHWISQRDDTVRNAQAWSDTNRNYVGSEDLDAYGSWTNVPDYGNVWVPAVAPGWAPYRAGRWVWYPYYGWTWVSYEPWGWAPYHYGRWFLYAGNWAWWPGPVYPAYNPVWAPAYVSFVGFGGGWGFSFGFGFGSIGWYPIGPCDYYRPWWGRYGGSYNVTNIYNTTNIYNNGNRYQVPVANGFINPLHSGNQFSNVNMLATHPQMRLAVSTVSSEHFGTGLGKVTPATEEMLRNGKMFNGAVPVVPSRESLSASGHPANVATLPRTTQPTHFFGSTPVSRTESFSQQQTRVQQVLLRDSNTAANQTGANSFQAGTGQHGSTVPVARGTTPNAGGSTLARNDGWMRFGQNLDQAKSAPSAPGAPAAPAGKPSAGKPSPEPVRTAPSPAPRGNPQPVAPENGWHKFSDPAPAHNSGTAQPAPAQTHPGNSYHPVTSPAPVARPVEAPRNDSWQRFNQAPRAPAESGVHQEWTRPAPTSVPEAPRNENRSLGWGEPSRVERTAPMSSRPPLDMRQPIVSPRPVSAPSAPHEAPHNSGGGHTAPSSSGSSPHGSHH